MHCGQNSIFVLFDIQCNRCVLFIALLLYSVTKSNMILPKFMSACFESFHGTSSLCEKKKIMCEERMGSCTVRCKILLFHNEIASTIQN